VNDVLSSASSGIRRLRYRLQAHHQNTPITALAINQMGRRIFAGVHSLMNSLNCAYVHKIQDKHEKGRRTPQKEDLSTALATNSGEPLEKLEFKALS
jgi:hypothetical protein